MRRRFVTGPLMLAVVSMSCGRDPAKESAPAPAPAVRDVVLAQSKAEWPELTIQVVEVSRDQSGLTVRFRFVNASAQPFPLGDRFAADSADHDSLAGVALVDPSGRRKYFVLRDRDNRPVCSRDLPPLEPGERRLLFARFPAPLAGTSRITIQIPHAPDLPEVPVAGAGGQEGRGVV